jgi:HSP20 family molecular chaperone IbpA
LALTAGVDTDKITADISNGVLKVPKPAASRPRRST